jgi:hypothetical protein
MIRGHLVPRCPWWLATPAALAATPAECEAEAEAAVALLDAYNAAVAAGTNLAALATPSPDACRWCPFEPFCPAFWSSVNPGWSGQLDGEVIRGIVSAPPQPLSCPRRLLSYR